MHNIYMVRTPELVYAQVKYRRHLIVSAAAVLQTSALYTRDATVALSTNHDCRCGAPRNCIVVSKPCDIGQSSIVRPDIVLGGAIDGHGTSIQWKVRAISRIICWSVVKVHDIETNLCIRTWLYCCYTGFVSLPAGFVNYCRGARTYSAADVEQMSIFCMGGRWSDLTSPTSSREGNIERCVTWQHGHAVRTDRHWVPRSTMMKIRSWKSVACPLWWELPNAAIPTIGLRCQAMLMLKKKMHGSLYGCPWKVPKTCICMLAQMCIEGLSATCREARANMHGKLQRRD